MMSKRPKAGAGSSSSRSSYVERRATRAVKAAIDPVPGQLRRAHAALSRVVQPSVRRAQDWGDSSGRVIERMPGRRALNATVAERYHASRVEHPAGPVLSASTVVDGVHPRPENKMKSRKPGEYVTEKRGLDIREDKNACLRDNRPTDTKGNGGSRPFVPWCQKGKR